MGLPIGPTQGSPIIITYSKEVDLLDFMSSQFSEDRISSTMLSLRFFLLFFLLTVLTTG